MTSHDDHGTLPAHAERMLTRVEGLHALSVHGPAMHMQHVDHAKRAGQLANHLRSVLVLSDARLYPSALVVVRAALEHHLMDRLILLANRHIVTYTKAKKKDAARWETDIRALQAKGSDI